MAAPATYLYYLYYRLGRRAYLRQTKGELKSLHWKKYRRVAEYTLCHKPTNPFLLFIRKKKANMAAPREAHFRSKKQTSTLPPPPPHAHTNICCLNTKTTTKMKPTDGNICICCTFSGQLAFHFRSPESRGGGSCGIFHFRSTLSSSLLRAEQVKVSVVLRPWPPMILWHSVHADHCSQIPVCHKQTEQLML